MMRRILRRPAVRTLGIVLLGMLLVLRILPRIVPWSPDTALQDWSAVLLARGGDLLQVRPVNAEGLRRIYADTRYVPRSLLRIIRISEDRRFYLHPGFDPPALMRAAFHRLREENSQGGGSTITMQLVRILSPRKPGTVVNAAMKLQEMGEALQIESRYSKHEILDLYFNRVPFGRNIEGYPTAAHLYFDRNIAELEPEEMCILAIVPRSPSQLHPMSPSNRIAAHRLARRALKNSYNRNRMDAAYRRIQEHNPWPFEAPHFVEHLMATRDEWDTDRGRIPVHTTLDLRMQKSAEALLDYHVDLAEGFRISNGAMLLADARTMDVLVYLGSADFHDAEHAGEIDGVRMLREPGSTLKPFLYATALDARWSASTILPDIPSEYGSQFSYTPMNYNQQFHGPVRLRQALAASLNIPAVHTLEQLGVDRFIDTLLSSGFTSLEDQRPQLGVSLAVGGGEVSLWELVQGYVALRNGGFYRRLRLTAALSSKAVRVWSLESADIITDILSHSDDRVLTFGRGGVLNYDYPAAIKTGTSNQFNNIWALGYTADLAGGVWMGNFDGSTVIAAPGSSLPATVLREAFDQWSTKGALVRHSELEQHSICSVSGKLATPECPYTMVEYFAPGTVPPDCDWHVRDGATGKITLIYPQEYAYWSGRYGYNLQFSSASPLGITYPPEGVVFYGNIAGRLRISLIGTGTGQLDVNGTRIYRGPLPADLQWIPVPGEVHLRLQSGRETVHRRFEVR